MRMSFERSLLLTILLFSQSGHSMVSEPMSGECEIFLQGSRSLSSYIETSAELPLIFNILALRKFQQSQGLPMFTKLADRFKRSFETLYGSKSSNRIEQFLGSPISAELGTGWMSRVVQLKNGRVFKLIIRERGRTANVGILFESEAWVTFHLQRNEALYQIKTLPILSVGPNGMYLEKPLVVSNSIGDKVFAVGLTELQINRLKFLHQNAIRLAEDTGISLDLKSSNMFWDGLDWVLLDPIGSIGYKGYARTLDARDFNEFYLRWSDSTVIQDNGLTIDDVVKMFPEIRFL